MADWEDVKARAAETGQDLTAMVHELTHRAQPPPVMTEIPRIVSVDDHVVEPAHVWERWLPAEFRDRGPRVVRRGIREIDYVGTASYVEHFDDDSPTKVDCWIYEDLVYTHKRMVAAAGLPQGGDDPHPDHLRRHAPRLL